MNIEKSYFLIKSDGDIQQIKIFDDNINEILNCDVVECENLEYLIDFGYNCKVYKKNNYKNKNKLNLNALTICLE